VALPLHFVSAMLCTKGLPMKTLGIFFSVLFSFITNAHAESEVWRQIQEQQINIIVEQGCSAMWEKDSKKECQEAGVRLQTSVPTTDLNQLDKNKVGLILRLCTLPQQKDSKSPIFAADRLSCYKDAVNAARFQSVNPAWYAWYTIIKKSGKIVPANLYIDKENYDNLRVLEKQMTDFLSARS
jgi:hypothetical protein